MDINKHTEDCTDETVPHLPMGQLFYMLHSNGFNVKPDDYIEMLKITERFGSGSIDETARWICPVIATSESEQLRFYNIVEQYKKATIQPCAEPAIKKRPVKWLKMAIAFFALALLLVIIYFSLQRNVAGLEETNKERTIEKGVPLQLDALNLLKDRLKDTAQIDFTWRFNDGTVQKGTRVSHVFNEPGNYLVKRQFYSRTIPLLKRSDSLLIHVCNDLPKLTIKIPAATVMVKQPVTITAAVDADTGTVSYYQWTINDSVFTTQLPQVNDFVFLNEGDFPVECKAVVGNVSSPCTVTDNQIIQVLSNTIHYNTHFSVAESGSYPAKSKPKWWVTLSTILVLGASSVHIFLKRKTRPPVVQEEKPVSAIVTKGPYDIPFEQNDTKLVQPEPALRHTFIQMRYNAEEDTLVLSIHGTINSIIQSGGSPQLVFTPLVQKQQYLLLIDRTNSKSMLTHFFGYLAKSMAAEGIPVIVFYYDKDFLCYNDQNPAGLSLQRMADAWRHSTLIILGKAHELVYAVYPVMQEAFLKELSRWQNKAIITPVPLEDWGAKEKVLQEYIILLPADVTALQKLMPAIREKIKLSKDLLEITEPEHPSIRDIDFRDMTELQNYLNKDEAVFQWLCAICIYPRLKWEVFIAIGKAIFDKYGQPESLNYSNLLKLCRISWMQQGVFPQATRLELLKLLKTDNEICARETLLHLLNYSTVIYGDNGHFFEEEKRRQVLTNQFVLQASNQARYSQYAASKEAFKKLWKNDALLDMPVKKYLDKKSGDDWQTPINDGEKSVGLSTYFGLQELTLDKTFNTTKALTLAAAVLTIALWAFIKYGNGAEKFEPLSSLIQLEDPTTVSVTMKVLKNFKRCGDSLQHFDQLDGYLEIDNKRFALLYNQKTSTALFKVPYKKIVTGTGKMVFTWNVNKSVITRMNFKNTHLPDSVTIGCFDADKIRKQYLYVRYNDTAGYRNIEAALNNALYRYTLSPLPADFTDSSRIIYYETNEKPRADSIAAIIKQTFNINVKEEFIPEERIPPAPPMLFLNTSITPGIDSTDDRITGIDNSELNKEDADDYHRIADDYFMKKQYQKAIAQYTLATNLNPKDALAYYQMGVSYEMMNAANSDKAIAAYTSAIRLNDKDVLSYYRRGSIKYELKKYAEAVPDYNKVIAINAANAKPQYTSSLYFRGKCRFFLNDLSGACEDFKKAGDAGMAAGKKDYGVYCAVANNPLNKAPDYKQKKNKKVTPLKAD